MAAGHGGTEPQSLRGGADEHRAYRCWRLADCGDLMIEPVEIRDRVITPPTAPGVGIVEVSENLLAKYPYILGTGEVCQVRQRLREESFEINKCAD